MGNHRNMAPKEWLDSADTVISFFVPLSEQIRVSNRTEKDAPYEKDIPQRCSVEWLYGR